MHNALRLKVSGRGGGGGGGGEQGEAVGGRGERHTHLIIYCTLVVLGLQKNYIYIAPFKTLYIAVYTYISISSNRAHTGPNIHCTCTYQIHVSVSLMQELPCRKYAKKIDTSKVKQTRQSNTAHPRQSLYKRKMSCLGWDSNPQHSKF